MINSTSRGSAAHTFIYSEGIDWTNISMPEVSNNSEQLSLLILQPSSITEGCWCARPPPSSRPLSPRTSGAHILCRVCCEAISRCSAGVNPPTPNPTPLIERASSLSRASLKPEQRLKAPVFLSQALQRGAGGGMHFTAQNTHSSTALCAPIKMHQVQITCWFTV